MKTTNHMPERIAALPLDDKERPVPFFVLWKDGKPDFRIADPAKIYQCYHEGLCWICGQKLGTYLAFVVGPMCTVNKISAEPPGHLDCGQYAVRACPFLIQPKMVRREGGLPEELAAPPGVFFKENPGVTAIWVTKSFTPLLKDGMLVARLGAPTQVLWYARGEQAGLSDVMEAFRAGAERFYERLGHDLAATWRFERDVKLAKLYWPKE